MQENSELANLVLSHIEHHFHWPPKWVWRESNDGSLQPFQIFCFADAPAAGSNTYMTYGLSSHVVQVGADFKARVEFVMTVKNDPGTDSVANLLRTLGNHLRRTHYLTSLHAVLPGEGAVFDNPAFEHLYLTTPRYHPSSFYKLEATQPPTYFVFVFPITSRERSYIEQHSSEAFEKSIEAQRVNVLALDKRNEVVIPNSLSDLSPRNARIDHPDSNLKKPGQTTNK